MANEERNRGFSAEDERLPNLTVRDVLYVLLRHWRAGVLFFAAVTVGGILFVLAAPNVYHSEAQILVKGGRSPLTRDPEIAIPDADGSPNQVQNAVAIMQSRSVAEKTVDHIGEKAILQPPAPHSFPARLAARLRALSNSANGTGHDRDALWRNAVSAATNGLRVKAIGNTIRVEYLAQDPYLAQRALSSLLEFYLQKHIEVYTAQVSPQFFEREASKALDALTKKEAEIEAFRKQYNITSLEDQKSQALDAVSQIRSSLRDTSAEMSASQARIKSYEEQIVSLASGKREGAEAVGALTFAAPSAYMSQIKQRLLDLRVREAETARRYPDGALPLEDIRDQIRITEEAMKKEAREAPTAAIGPDGQAVAGNPAAQQMVSLLETERAQLKGHQARQAVLSKELAEAESTLTPLRNLETTLNRIGLERSVLESKYVEARGNLERSQVTSALDKEMVSNVKIIQPATLSLEPVLPNRTRNAALVLFAAFFGGIALAFCLEYLDHTLKTNDDVEKRLGLPVLTTVSEEEFKSCI